MPCRQPVDIESEGLSFYLNVADVLPELGGEDDQLGDVDAVARVGGAVKLQVRNLHPRNLVLEEPAMRETDSLSSPPLDNDSHSIAAAEELIIQCNVS